MSKPVVPVEIRTVLPFNSGRAVFIGNDEKVFVIYVDESVGAAISMFDHFSPKYQYRYTPEQVRTMFEHAGLLSVRDVTFDNENLYVAFRAYDPHPEQIRAHLANDE